MLVQPDSRRLQVSTEATHRFHRTLFISLESVLDHTGNLRSAWAGTSFTYDLDGNPLTKGAQAFDWDARNRLDSIGGTTAASFQYDGLRRRISKTVGGAATDFLYDGPSAVQELAGGTPTANLLNGPAIDEVLSRTDALGARGVLADALGSTIALTDATGAMLTQYTYEPFGAAAITGESNGNPSQFTGREADGTGLYYYRARYYDPTTQRFASEDPWALRRAMRTCMRTCSTIRRI